MKARAIVLLGVLVVGCFRAFSEGEPESWADVDDGWYVTDHRFRGILVLQEPVHPPYQPYPNRYIVIGPEGNAELTASSQLVTVVQSSKDVFARREERHGLFEALVPYVALLKRGYPQKDLVVVEELDEIPGLTAQQRQALSDPSGYGYREDVAGSEVVAKGGYWSPIGGTLTELQLRFIDRRLAEIEVKEIASGVGQTVGVE